MWDRKEVHEKIFGISKSLGEGTMTIEALEYIKKNQIQFNNLFKICGRYWLSEKFDYKIYDNSNIMFKKIRGNIKNIFTSFYKIPKNNVNILLDFLKDNEIFMKRGIGYEVLFSKFLNHIKYANTIFIDNIGYEGQVTVCGSNYVG